MKAQADAWRRTFGWVGVFMAYDRSKTVGRVAFLAHHETIRDLLNKGHRNKEVFTELEAKLGTSYSQFNRYVLRYITGEQSEGHQKEGAAQLMPIVPSPAPLPPPTRDIYNNNTIAPRAGQKTEKFKHDPNSGNIRDDLI
jgi:hypothetical protein